MATLWAPKTLQKGYCNLWVPEIHFEGWGSTISYPEAPYQGLIRARDQGCITAISAGNPSSGFVALFTEPCARLAHLVADEVAGGVHLEELRAALLVDAQQDGHHRQRPHVRCLRHRPAPQK